VTEFTTCRECGDRTLAAAYGICPTCGENEDVLARHLVPVRWHRHCRQWRLWVSKVPLQRYKGERNRKRKAERKARQEARVLAGKPAKGFPAGTRRRHPATSATADMTDAELEDLIAERSRDLPGWWHEPDPDGDE
jgi:hypothetical protein